MNQHNDFKRGDELLTKKQLAHRLQVTTRSIDQYMAFRGLPYFKVGRTVRFDWTVVAQWLCSHQIGGFAEKGQSNG
ncbi:DNA-binding protein [bacterium]|nr:DNA-binding protein [bacterium]MDA7645371.1 DNA-binding protein [bacterium]